MLFYVLSVITFDGYEGGDLTGSYLTLLLNDVIPAIALYLWPFTYGDAQRSPIDGE